jgi:hypothetical protein
MESYYFHNGIDKLGPFSFDELKRQPIDKNTAIWKDGMKDWMKAAELDELRPFVVPAPPEFKRASTIERVGVQIGRNLGWAIILLIAGLTAFWALDKYNGRNSYLPLPPPVVDQERINPVNFLSATGGTYKPNFWLTKWTIDGSVSNFVTHTNYKDVHIKINFYSRTNTVIDTKEYVLYDYFPYGLKKGFNLVVDRPAAATSCGWQAVGATVY